MEAICVCDDHKRMKEANVEGIGDTIADAASEMLKTVIAEKIARLQLTSRMQTLKKTKTNLDKQWEEARTDYLSNCKKVEEMANIFCDRTDEFVRNDSLFREAREKRRTTFADESVKLRQRQSKFENEIQAWKAKVEVQNKNREMIRNLQLKLDGLIQTKQELEKESAGLLKRIENLKEEKTMAANLPDHDPTFLRLKTTFIRLRESVSKNEQKCKELEDEYTRLIYKPPDRKFKFKK